MEDARDGLLRQLLSEAPFGVGGTLSPPPSGPLPGCLAGAAAAGAAVVPAGGAGSASARSGLRAAAGGVERSPLSELAAGPGAGAAAAAAVDAGRAGGRSSPCCLSVAGLVDTVAASPLAAGADVGADLGDVVSVLRAPLPLSWLSWLA